MESAPPKKKFLSKAAVQHHNNACKRPMLLQQISDDEKAPRNNYPAAQHDEKYLFQTLLMSSEDAVPDQNSKARMKWSYKLPVMYCKVDVCQMTFRTTLDISDSQISRVQQRMVQNCEIFPRNMRGRHDIRPQRILDDTVDAIQAHLKSYNPIENHYSRNNFVLGNLQVIRVTLSTYSVRVPSVLDEEKSNLQTHMQQTKFTPQLSCSTAFYMRKFCTYNLCIHDESKNKGHMFLWNECDAKKGAHKVASCIYKFITRKYNPLQSGIKRSLVVWSDRCVGQNNNYTMLIFHRKLIQDNYFTDIYQKFMVSGHSYLSCDTDFALIENQMKNRFLKSPLEIPDILKIANMVTPFEVTEMTQSSFFDLKPLENYWKRPADLKVSHSLLFYQSTDSTQIFTKQSHSEDQAWEVFDIKLRSQMLDSAGIPQIDGKLKYHSLLTLKTGKQKDIAKLLKFLPALDKCFFQERIRLETDAELGDVDDEEVNLFGSPDVEL
ncbi:unnamed protein product [Allacma fusca]|uniref:DUF7869 domain-containing protein n=1 Tax=Allacma fusca TaxID=39272 RepID=A0A8J2JJ13_9HEXA|nr:unnamed protein product [Allacma fusca]